MKKLFQIIGIASFTFFGFYVTERTTVVLKEKDTIMYQIKKEAPNYSSDSVNATIDNNTIIPGIYGKEVNISKSYKKMKNMGLYDESLYIYDNLKPDISASDNLDHYITSGNPRKNMVSLLFIVNQSSVSDIVSKVGDNQVGFIVNRYWIEENRNLSKELIKLKHNILLSTTTNTNETLNKLDQTTYCYNPNQDNKFLNNCVSYKWPTIAPTIKIDNNPLLEVKSKAVPGSIIVFTINDQVIKELPNIISYLNSKGFQITNINDHLNEQV